MARVLLLDKLLLKWVKFCKFRLSRDGGLFQLLKSETASIFFRPALHRDTFWEDLVRNHDNFALEFSEKS